MNAKKGYGNARLTHSTLTRFVHFRFSSSKLVGEEQISFQSQYLGLFDTIEIFIHDDDALYSVLL